MNKWVRFMLILLLIVGLAIPISLGYTKIFANDNAVDNVEDNKVESNTEVDNEPSAKDNAEIKDDVDINSHIDMEEPTFHSEEVYKFTTDNLNLRFGPGTDKGIILTIPMGEKVKVIGHENGWDKLIYKDEIGYSSAKYLSETEIEIPPDKDDELEIVESTETMTIINGILLVNKEYSLPMDYNPGENPEAKDYLSQMNRACEEEIGKTLVAFSGYRTYEYQKNLFNRYVKKEGYDKAVMYSAKPRHSEHETGLAYDIGDKSQKYWLKEAFEDTEEGIWLRENAHRFGFILRYPKDKTDITGYIYEPWHFRYIGVEHATNIYEKGVTLEEYLLY